MKKKEENEESAREITEEEIRKQIKKLKNKKAEQIGRLNELINKVWREEGFPESWKEGVIAPIYKKGDKNRVSNYRGITLLNTAYKVYALCLEEKLKIEMEEKR